jgi:hypothetical protein
MTPRVVPLEPFGIRVVFPPGTRLADVDIPLLKAWVAADDRSATCPIQRFQVSLRA